MPRTIDDPALTPLRRAELLAALCDEALSQQEIVSDLDYARTTAYRTLDTLLDRGLIEEAESGYVTTPTGTALAGLADRYLAAVEAIDRLEPVLDAVEHPKLFECWELFADATVRVSNRESPHSMADHLVALVDRAPTVSVGLSGVTTVDAFERIVASSIRQEATTFLFTPSSIEAHRTVSQTAMEELVTAPEVEVCVSPELPFSCVVSDRTVSVLGHDDTTGFPVAMAETDEALARAYVRTVFERHRASAEQLEEPV